MQLYNVNQHEFLENPQAQLRWKIHDTLVKNHLVHPDGRQFIPESLAKEMVQELVDTGVDKKASIGVIDYACLLVAHLKQAGFININYIEDIPESLDEEDEMYYNLITGLCSSMDVPIVTLDTDMKFDVIIGNPPYQDSSRESAFTNLWSEFFVRSFRELLNQNGFMILVHPTTWGTPKDGNRQGGNNEVRSILSEHCVAINYNECGRHFKGVGSSFCYTVTSYNRNSGVCRVVTEEDKFVVDSPADFIDNVLSHDNTPLALSIVSKIRKHEMLPQASGKRGLVGNLVTDQDDSHPYRVQYAATTVRWSNRCHPMQNEAKIIFPNQTTRNYPIYDDGVSAPAARGSVFFVSGKEEGENIVETMKSSVMQFFISHLRFHHGLLNRVVLNSIPLLNYNHIWTDEELANEFGLTEEEFNYILQNA